MSMPSKFAPRSSGVYAAPADMSKLRAQAASSHAVWLELGGERVRDKSGLMSLIAATLHFPPGFGANWDALADSLQDFSWMSAAGYVLHVRHAEALRQALGADWDRLLDVLQATAGYWAERSKPFVVIMDGAEGLPSWP